MSGRKDLRDSRENIMPSARVRAAAILQSFHEAEAELIGKAVVLSDGKAGVIEKICLDELHGLRIAVRGHDGKWPVSTIKFLKKNELSGL
jgi:hypothetical protein